MKNKILNYLKKQKKPMDAKALSLAFDMTSPDDFKALIKALNELERERKILLDDHYRYKVLNMSKTLTGKLDLKAKGYGFLIPDQKDIPDVYIPAHATLGAMNKDTVMIELSSHSHRRQEGRVIQIIKRYYNEIIGTVKLKQRHPILKPKDRSIKLPIYITKKSLHNINHNDVVKVLIHQYDHHALLGKVTEKLGEKDDPNLNVMIKTIQHGIDPIMPKKVIQEAETLDLSDISNRQDLSGLTTFTIDGEDAKDFDDALSIQTDDKGITLYVHIADVAHFVKPGSLIDLEAYERGTSVYLPTKVYPMLPEKLSNDLCSLKPNVHRFTVTCEMHFNKAYQMDEYKVYKSVIESNHRFTYKRVNHLFEGRKPSEEELSLLPLLRNLNTFAKTLRKSRMEKGSLEFETDEIYFSYDKSGKAKGIHIKERGDAEKLVEECMLKANQAVAMILKDKELPGIYRVHDAPERDTLERLRDIASHLGFEIESKDIESHEALQSLTKAFKSTPFEKGLTMLLLRSMQKAVYQDHQTPHYGLGFDHYTHFTSPIRRYPDLIVHRILDTFLFKQSTHQEKMTLTNQMQKIAKQSSLQERKALDLERDVISMTKAQTMVSKIGLTFEGIITSVVPFGLYVTLENTIEGLIHISKLTHAFFKYDETTHRLVSLESDEAYQLGDKIMVQLEKVHVFDGELDFILGDPNENHRPEQKGDL